MTVEQVTQLKSRIEKAKQQLASLEGQLIEVKKTLQSMGIKKVNDLESVITETEQELHDLDIQKNSLIGKLEDEFPQLFE